MAPWLRTSSRAICPSPARFPMAQQHCAQSSAHLASVVLKCVLVWSGVVVDVDVDVDVDVVAAVWLWDA